MPPRAKILLVDDDLDLTTTLRVVLESADYEVVTANGLDTGLAAADKERPDLILLDIMMPEATEGFHFVWRLRKREEEYFAQVPIVVLSAIHRRTDLRFYPDDGDGTYQAGEFLPIQEFLDKPVEPDRLIDLVAKVLGRGRPTERETSLIP